MKLNIISDEEILAAIEGAPVINMPAPISRMVDTEATRGAQRRSIAQAQLDSCQKQVNELVGEIFREIDILVDAGYFDYTARQGIIKIKKKFGAK